MILVGPKFGNAECGLRLIANGGFPKMRFIAMPSVDPRRPKNLAYLVVVGAYCDRGSRCATTVLKSLVDDQLWSWEMEDFRSRQIFPDSG